MGNATYNSKTGEIHQPGGYNVAHIGHYISQGFDKAFNKANEYGHRWFGGGPGEDPNEGTSWYVGNENGQPIITTGDTAEAIMQGKLHQNIPDGNRQINDDDYQAAITQTPTYTTPVGNMPKAYQGNAAKTATSIKQGGMTKDELIDFNNRHPNETA